MSRRIQNDKALLWFGAALLLIAVFLQFTNEFLQQPSPGTFDLLVIRKLSELRSPLLTTFFVNWTALGSTTLISLHTVIAFVLLVYAGDRRGAAQLATASGGAFLLTALTKDFFERPRPTAVPALIDFTGFSYPSGHSLAAAAMYVTMTILACRHLATFRQRAIVCALTALVVIGIGISRVYLGAHYLSDVAGGILVGTAWALALAGAFSITENRV